MAGLLDLFARLFSPPVSSAKRSDDAELDVESGALMREDPEQNELEFLAEYDEYWRLVMGVRDGHPESESDLYVNMMVIGDFVWMDSHNPIAKALYKTYTHRGAPVPEAMFKSLRAGKCYIYRLDQVRESTEWVAALYGKHKRMRTPQAEGLR